LSCANNNFICPFNPYRAKSELIDMLVEAMKDERSDRAKYKVLMDMTTDEKVKRQINFAYEDEGKHYKLFQNIYQQLTGQYLDIPEAQPKHYKDLLTEIQTSIDGELEAVELYRKIMAMLPNQQMRDTLYEIITDEQEHATRFVYLYAMEKRK
jgi:Rubrerythrin.